MPWNFFLLDFKPFQAIFGDAHKFWPNVVRGGQVGGGMQADGV